MTALTSPTRGEPCVAQMHLRAEKIIVAGTLMILCPLCAWSLWGAEGLPRGHGRWEHDYVNAFVRPRASGNRQRFTQK
jgi:hypothetical protein